MSLAASSSPIVASTDWVQWPVLTGVTIRDTVGELARKVVAAQAFYVRIDLDEGAPEFATIYGPFGLRRRLSTLADAIGPRILTLELAQVPDLFTVSGPTMHDDPRDDRTSLVIETETVHVATKGDEVIGAISQGMTYHAVPEPVAVFADPPAFDRGEHGRHARLCSSCQQPVSSRSRARCARARFGAGRPLKSAGRVPSTMRSGAMSRERVVHDDVCQRPTWRSRDIQPNTSTSWSTIQTRKLVLSNATTAGSRNRRGDGPRPTDCRAR